MQSRLFLLVHGIVAVASMLPATASAHGVAAGAASGMVWAGHDEGAAGVVAGTLPPYREVNHSRRLSADHRIATDSIYALAVDSAAYREFPLVFLLDEGLFRHEADGRSTRTFRQVVQLLKPSAVRQTAERQLSYQPSHQRLTLNWARVVKPSGEVISDKPAQMQESDVTASMNNPVYTEQKVLRFSLSGVAPGTIVDLSWTIEEIKPYLEGNFMDGWNITLQQPTRRSHIVLDVPASLTPRIVEHHLTVQRQEREASGRRVYTWTALDVKPVRREWFAPDSSIPAMSIRMSAPLTWSDVGKWYAGLANGRYALTPLVAAAVDSVVRRAYTSDDTLRLLHQWIARDIRYVSVSLGVGGYQPRDPETTLTTGFGDCKDKATLFIAAARHLGFEAYPVLLNSFDVTDRRLVAIEQFNHAIAAVRRKGAGAPYTYLDLTTDLFPTGTVPPDYQGHFGLVVLDGGVEEITFPTMGGGSSEQTFIGEVNADGIASGRYRAVGRGMPEYMMRMTFSVPQDSTARDRMKQAYARFVPGATVDTVVAFDGKDWMAPASVEAQLHGAAIAKPAGPVMILTLPPAFRSPAVRYRKMFEDIDRSPPRTLPIDIATVGGPVSISTELRLTLPAGWTAQLPKPASVTSRFGTYTSEYSQQGRALRVAYRLTGGGTGVLPASDVGLLKDWLKAVAQDDVEFIAISKGS